MHRLIEIHCHSIVVALAAENSSHSVADIKHEQLWNEMLEDKGIPLHSVLKRFVSGDYVTYEITMFKKVSIDLERRLNNGT